MPSQPDPKGPQLAAGVIAVDKPRGWTSHDVVAVARGALGVRRVGHGGTLDPLATGVLPLLVGPATRFVERLHTGRKVYAAVVRFGAETMTDDAEGEVRASAPAPGIDEAGLDAALDAFRGDIEQAPPAHSAVKVDGRRAYALARAGVDVTLAARTVRVDRIAVASWDPPALRLLIVCGPGTYVRSLARDLGRALGSAAHLGALRRLAVGALDAEDAIPVEALRSAGHQTLVARLRPASDDLLQLNERYLRDDAGAIIGAWEAS